MRYLDVAALAAIHYFSFYQAAYSLLGSIINPVITITETVDIYIIQWIQILLVPYANMSSPINHKPILRDFTPYVVQIFMVAAVTCYDARLAHTIHIFVDLI